MVGCHLPVSCLLRRAAVFPHKKPEQFITCSAARVTRSSCSHAPSPCSLQPDTRSCILAGDAARAALVTAGETLRGQLVPSCTPRNGTAGLSLGRGHKPEPLAPLTLTGMGEILLLSLLWKRRRCLTCWFLLLFFFFPLFFSQKNNLDSWSTQKGPLFSSQLIMQLSPWSLMLLL